MTPPRRPLGRPTELPTARQCCALLTAEQIATAERLGAGNVARGIRAALDGWIRTTDNPPIPGVEYWVITHTAKHGHRPAIGEYINAERGWSINGVSGGPVKMRPRVIWHKEIVWPGMAGKGKP